MSRFTSHLAAAAVLSCLAGIAAAQQPTPPAPTPAPAGAPAPTPAPAAKAESAGAAAVAPVAAAAAAPAAKPAATTSAAQLQQRLAEFLLRGITLTPEQKTKLEALMAQHREDRLAFGGTTMDSTAMAARIKLVRRHMAENRAVLTEDQQKIYDKNLAELRELFAQ